MSKVAKVYTNEDMEEVLNRLGGVSKAVVRKSKPAGTARKGKLKPEKTTKRKINVE
jgi:hypothetical protein